MTERENGATVREMFLFPKLAFAAAPLALAAAVRSADGGIIARASGLIIGSGAAAS